jgi:hypothetical protein
MAMATGTYVIGLKSLLDGTIDADTDTLGVMLVQDGYTPNFTTHNFRDDVTNEPSNSGTYSAGGSALSGVSLTIASDTVELRASNPSWTGATLTARGCIIYRRRGGASSADDLLFALKFTPDADVSSTNGTFSIDFSGASNVIAVFDTTP